MRISELLTKHGSDKCTDHSYAGFYDRLFEEKSLNVIVEIGVFKGASLRAWCDHDPGRTVIGIDMNPPRMADPPENCRLLRSSAPLFREVVDSFGAETIQCDLIIDDGSHVLSHQVAAADQLSQFLSPGGIMVIEDLQNENAIATFRNKGWRIIDLRPVKKRWDDVLAVFEAP